MSDPDHPPPSEPRLEDFRRKPRVEPGPGADTPDVRSGSASGFLSGCGAILLVVFGFVLLLPGLCFMKIGGEDSIGAVFLMLALSAIGGGIALLAGRRKIPPS